MWMGCWAWWIFLKVKTQFRWLKFICASVQRVHPDSCQLQPFEAVVVVYCLWLFFFFFFSWFRSPFVGVWNDAEAETPVLWPHEKTWLIGKDSDAGRDWGQEEKATREDEMAGWHHWHDGRESEWTQGVGDRQGGLAYCNSRGRKESDMTERLNWTELNFFSNKLCESFSSTSVWFVSVEDKKLEVYKGLPRWRCSWACHWVLSLLDPLSSFTGIPAG